MKWSNFKRGSCHYLPICSLKYKQVTGWNPFDIRDPTTVYLLVFNIVTMVSYGKWFDALNTWNSVVLNNLFASKRDTFNWFLVLATKGNTELTVGSRIFKHFIISFCKGLTRFWTHTDTTYLAFQSKQWLSENFFCCWFYSYTSCNLRIECNFIILVFLSDYF